MNKIQELYDDPKSKGFVTHLIRAYLPIYKCSKVWEFKKNQKPFCNVCNHELISLGETLGEMYALDKEENQKEFADYLRKSLLGEADTGDNPMLKHLKGRILAWTGEKTDTCLCLECIQDLLKVFQFAILDGNKHMVWLSNQMQRDEVFQTFDESPNLNEAEKDQVKDIKKKVDKDKKITTFGDLEVLQKLKKKMENEKEE
jgi:hypothetical protein